MKCFIISPLNHLGLMHLGNAGYFCLTHLYITNKNYREFFKIRQQENIFIILDNSAAERSLVTEDRLIEVVRDLEPTEVIAPDILFDKNKTLKNLDSFIRRMIKENLIDKTKIFACPQGNNQKEWLDCYGEMLINPYVEVIGLSKISVPYCWYNKAKNDEHIAEARQKCVKYLVKHDLIEKPLHCLGMGNPDEYKAYKHRLIRSTDSCYTVLAAIHGIKFGESKFKRAVTTNDYFKTVLTKQQIKIAKHNIEYLKKILRRVN